MKLPLRPATRTFRTILGTSLVLAAVLVGCGPPETVEEIYSPRASHAEYLRGLEGMGLAESDMGSAWILAADPDTRRHPLSLLPLAELRHFSRSQPAAAFFLFEAIPGQEIRIQILAPDGESYFADLFGAQDEFDPRDPESEPAYQLAASAHFPANAEQAASAEQAAQGLPAGPIRQGDSEIVFGPRRNRFYLLRLQPELLAGGAWEVRIGYAPVAKVWPVEGTGPRQVWSYFGDPRDGGARAHHGVDIFAPKGTPILAPVDAVVSRVGERDRGGKTVSLVDDLGYRYYFAHLDSYGDIAEGQRIPAGTLIGRVGNTGNAITTPHHLHLGIYDRSWRGPVDPWYFLVGSAALQGADATLVQLAQSQDFVLGRWYRAEDESFLTLHTQPASSSPQLLSPGTRNPWGDPLDAADLPIRTQSWDGELRPDGELPLQYVAARPGARAFRNASGEEFWVPLPVLLVSAASPAYN